MPRQEEEQRLTGPCIMAAYVCPPPTSRNKWKNVELTKRTRFIQTPDVPWKHCLPKSIDQFKREKKKWNDKWCPQLYWCKVKKASIEGGTQRPCKSKKLTSNHTGPVKSPSIRVDSCLVGERTDLTTEDCLAQLWWLVPDWLPHSVLNRCLHQSRQSEKAVKRLAVPPANQSHSQSAQLLKRR